MLRNDVKTKLVNIFFFSARKAERVSIVHPSAISSKTAKHYFFLLENLFADHKVYLTLTSIFNPSIRLIWFIFHWFQHTSQLFLFLNQHLIFSLWIYTYIPPYNAFSSSISKVNSCTTTIFPILPSYVTYLFFFCDFSFHPHTSFFFNFWPLKCANILHLLFLVDIWFDRKTNKKIFVTVIYIFLAFFVGIVVMWACICIIAITINGCKIKIKEKLKKTT